MATASQTASGVALRVERPLPVRLGQGLWKFIRQKPLGALGGFLVLVTVVFAAFAPQIAPYDYNDQQLTRRFRDPSRAHLLGTDHLGRDIFSRIVYGARVSVTIGFGAVALSTLLATTVGLTTGYIGGKLDTIAQRFVDIWIAFPGLVLLLFLISIFGAGRWQIVFAIGLLSAAGSSRVIRSAAIAVRHNQYVEGARCIGAGNLRILLTYILPNIAHVILIGATIGLGGAILAESSLSFLGFGVPPPFPTWGRMLSNEGREFMIRAPLLAVWPGLAITLTVFGFNVLGDALRDVLDPRLRGSR
jgi:peptide/nickel transport system permease protein